MVWYTDFRAVNLSKELLVDYADFLVTQLGIPSILNDSPSRKRELIQIKTNDDLLK